MFGPPHNHNRLLRFPRAWFAEHCGIVSPNLRSTRKSSVCQSRTVSCQRCYCSPEYIIARSCRPWTSGILNCTVSWSSKLFSVVVKFGEMSSATGLRRAIAKNHYSVVLCKWKSRASMNYIFFHVRFQAWNSTRFLLCCLNKVSRPILAWIISS